MASYENSEDYRTKEVPLAENENDYFVDEDSDDAEEIIAYPTDVSIPNGLLVILILLIYAGLMMTTGVMVYSTYGNDQVGTSLNGLVSPDIAVTGICPINDICPSTCIIDTNACIPQPKPPCIPQVWPTRTFCWEQVPSSCPVGSAGCNPVMCPTPSITTEPPIQAFRTFFYENHRVLDLLNLYPPNTPMRLEVVTTLLYKTVEQFAMLGHFHRCEGSLKDRPLFETVCSFCNDRYEYIRCVMSNQLVDQLYPDEPKTANHLVPIFWETELSKMHDDLVTTIYKTGLPSNLDYVFDRIAKMIRPFSVKTASGDECRICKDFNETVYDRCYTKDTWYTFPAHRQALPSLTDP